MEAPPSSDRRRGFRHIACFPGIVEHPNMESEKDTAMISDLSETGALLLLHGPDTKVGEELRLELHVIIDSDATRIVTGRVIRLEPLPDARASFWTYQAAVEFHETLTFDAAEIASLEKRRALLAKSR
jgi:hypothetical protein